MIMRKNLVLNSFLKCLAVWNVTGLLLFSCEPGVDSEEVQDTETVVQAFQFPAVAETFGGTIDLNNLYDYEGQSHPDYIDQDNTQGNTITNEGAVLGRVLFYDVNLSSDNTVSCASCHQQQFAFGDPEQLSTGVNGVTGRHSMRLINARFAEDRQFFWDERASTLEEQTTMPIQDHAEMGFSGQNGDPSFEDLIEILEAIEYYQELFTFVYGDEEVTEQRMQDAMAQFIRSIQSFDSKYDEGRAQVNSDNADFPNFNTEENLGKRLFMMSPRDGGANCNTCHRAPEFDIDPDSENNGVIASANSNAFDTEVERSPTLRDLVQPDGTSNGPMMHNGAFNTLRQVIDHYDNIPNNNNNNNLDNRLDGRRGDGQMLNLSNAEKEAIVAFLETLSGEAVYSAEQWSDPFQD
jgi:cytochrome c peroxidase